MSETVKQENLKEKLECRRKLLGKSLPIEKETRKLTRKNKENERKYEEVI